jgi:CRISPR-associated protein Csh2
MSKSLHRVSEPAFIKGTGAFASKPKAENKTFREEYILPYALFATYGVVNALNANKTEFSKHDLDAVLKGLWKGTKNLVTRSKMGQLPRFLLKVTYKEAGFFIGELDNHLRLVANAMEEHEIRSVHDYTLDFSKIVTLLEKYSDKIESVQYSIDDTFEALLIDLPTSWEHVALD